MNQYQKDVGDYYKAFDRGKMFGKFFMLASFAFFIWLFINLWGIFLGLIAGLVVGFIFGAFVGGSLIRIIFPKIKNDPTSTKKDQV